MASQANADLLVTDSVLIKILDCIDLFQSALIRTSPRAKGHGSGSKRMRVSDNIQVFEASLEEIGANWHSTLEQLFDSKLKEDSYERVAFSLMKTLKLTKRFFRVKDEYYKICINSITQPIINLLLEERKLEHKSKVRNDRITMFLKMIFEKSLKRHENISRDQISAANIWSQSQVPTVEIASQNFEGSSVDTIELHSIEEYMLMENLIQVFRVHVIKITDRNLDFTAHICSIMNMTCLTRIFNEQIMNLRSKLSALPNADLPPIRPSEKKLLKQSLESYECELRNLHQSIDVYNPWTLFRRELRNISIHLVMVKEMMKEKVQ